MYAKHNMQLDIFSNKTKIPRRKQKVRLWNTLIWYFHCTHSTSLSLQFKAMELYMFHIISFSVDVFIWFVWWADERADARGCVSVGMLETQLAEILMSDEHCLTSQYCCQVNRNQKVLTMCICGTRLFFFASLHANGISLQTNRHIESVFYSCYIHSQIIIWKPFWLT